MKDFKKEIEVIENMIRLLNECLAISLKNRRFSEAKRTRKDIALVQAEFKKIMEQKGIAEKVLAAKDELEAAKK